MELFPRRALLALLSLSSASAFLSLTRPTARASSLKVPSLSRALPTPVRQSGARRAARDATVMAAATFKVGIVGATGAVGEEIIGVLAKRGFPVATLHAFASAKSAGKTIAAGSFGDVVVEEFSVEAARKMDVVFLAVDGAFAKEFAEAIAANDGPFVIDNSSEFRRNDKYPLIVPEINGHLAKTSRLIANPNCTTAIGIMALYPLFKKYGLKRVIMSTYQASSGAGAPGMNELKEGIQAYAAAPPDVGAVQGGYPQVLKGSNAVFAHPLPFNVIPQIDVFQENGYTKEEMKVTWECQKIMGLPNLPVSCTAVRIPTFRAHSEAITIETEKPCPPDEARALLMTAKGVTVKDVPADKVYPMPVSATGEYNVEVGRIRKSLVFDNGLDFFVCGDQLLRGAALNAVLIAEVATGVTDFETA